MNNEKKLDLLEIKPLVDIKVIKETVNRIGIANKKKRIIYPSCYIYEKDNKILLVHFKQMFLLTRDNAYDALCPDDILRRNAVAFCLKNWRLIDVEESFITPHDRFVFVLPFNEKNEWKISHKFNLRSMNQF